MLLRTAKSCGPDAPTLASSSRSCVGPTGLRQNISADDGGKRARSPGRARHKPLKPLRAGMPGDSGVPVASTPVLSTLHRGLRVQRAPGIPHALHGGERFINASGASRRGVVSARLYLAPLLRGAQRPRRRHSGMVRRTRPQMRNCASGNLEIPGSMRSLSSGRALRGPVGIAPE
jgi:hypothetical protein